MSRLARLVLFLIVGLALLTWAVSGVVQTTARGWFERDVALRSHIMLLNAREQIRAAWNSEEIGRAHV